MNNIKKLREAANMTQYQLAQRMEVFPSAVYKWEMGRSNPTAENLLKLADILGCTTDEILGRKAQSTA